MQAAFKSLHGLYKVNSWLFTNAVKDITDEQARVQAGGRSNPFIWIAGHITHSRYQIVGVTGEKIESPLTDKGFKRGDKFDPAKIYPTVAEIKGHWDSISETLLARLSNLTEADLARTGFDGYPHGDNTLFGALSFLNFHESYHLGQLSHIRTCVGLEGLVK